MEHPSHRSRFGQIAAVFAHEVTELPDNAVAVSCDDLNQHAHSARAVAFKGRFLVLLAF